MYYKIVRFYKSGMRKTIKKVSTEEIAKLHCLDPRTAKAGVYFDGYTGPFYKTEREQVQTSGRF